MAVTVLGVAFRLVLAATFLVSASGKFVGGGDQLGNALRLSVPRPLARVSALAVTPLEFLLAALLLFGNKRTIEIGLGGSAGLLLVFSAWMASVLIRDLQLQCSCFGPSGAAVSWRHVARNGVLIAVALAGLLLVPTSRDPLGTTTWTGLAVAAGALLIVLGVALRRAFPALAFSVEQVTEAMNHEREDAYVG